MKTFIITPIIFEHQFKRTMKKNITLLLALAATLSACSNGPSKAELEAQQKLKHDSIQAAAYQAAEQKLQDSLRLVQEAEQARLKQVEDSLKTVAIDSLNRELEKAKKKAAAPKKSPEQKKQEQEIKEVKAATRGRG
jgi:hypothetical protein